ncbi:MAG: hypothetical protein IPJ30_21815 [Acidobacteria bacterium]|nr:hypothetical protein [Acidobacteriota bacterium]MBK8150804.1 hypothetical protein [Acidobacteriota bacterium]
MIYYRVRNQIVTPRFEGAHKWGLPGIDCRYCDCIWSGTGLEYPDIDFGRFSRLADCWPRPIPNAEFRDLEAAVRREFPQIRTLEPGTRFGPMTARATGVFKGFVWSMPWTVLLPRLVAEAIEGRGVKMPTLVPAEIVKGGTESELCELAIYPAGRLANGWYEPGVIEICPECNRDAVKLPEEIATDVSDVPDDVDVFRLSNFATILIVTERFYDAVSALGIKGAKFEKVGAV